MKEKYGPIHFYIHWLYDGACNEFQWRIEESQETHVQYHDFKHQGHA